MRFIHASGVMCLVAKRRKRMMKKEEEEGSEADFHTAWTLTEVHCVSIPPIAPPVSWVLAVKR